MSREDPVSSLSEALVRSLPSGVLVWRLVDAARDDSLALVLANAAAASLLGLAPGTLEGRPARALFPGVSPENLKACADVARAGAAGAEVGPPGARLPPGAFARTFVPLPGQCVAVVFDPVAAEAEAAAEVRTLNAFLDSIIENIPAKVFVKDAETLRFERLNKMCEEMLELPREQLLGKNDHDLFPREQAEFFKAKDREALEGRRLVDIPEEPIKTPRGQRWLHTKKIPILDEDGQPRHLLGISYDITDRKLAELNQTQKMDAIGRLAGGIAHDFNNLLSIILSYSSMLMDSLRSGDPQRAEVEQIAIAGQRARDLTRQLLAFSRRQAMIPEVLDLGQIVRGLEARVRRVLGENIELVFLGERPTALVKADRAQLQQLIMNLVVNARDAMPDGGTLTIATTDVQLGESDVRGLMGARPGAHVELSVIDTGHGMDEETRARAFEPFFTTKPTGKGAGLGLSTALGIAQQSGGYVTVESERGRGAAFRVYLPATAERPAPPVAVPAAPARRAAPGVPRGSETILLVEDEGQLRVLARTILRGAGYDVLDAPNAAEAVRVSETHDGPIHLLLTDVVMPHVGGRELARRLTAARPRMRVLYMSGYTSDAVVQPGVVEPGVAFLQKPITPELLLEAVREALG